MTPREVELKVRFEIPDDLIQQLRGELLEQASQSDLQSSRSPDPLVSANLYILGHDVVVPRLNGFKDIANRVQRFGKLDKASDDVAVYRLSRFSLWKAAQQGMTPDEVVDFLKKHSRSPPKASLRNWVARTMSLWGAVRIVGEEDYNVLEAADEATMTRIRSIKELNRHLYRQLSPTRWRIVNGRRAIVKRLLIDRGYPVKDLGLIEEFEPIKIDLKPELTPWPVQAEALERFVEAQNGVVIAPPGTGKTVIAVMATVHFKAPTLVLTTRAQICEQFKREYLKWTTISSYSISVIHGGSRDSTVKPITIVTYQTASGSKKRAAREIWKRSWGLIVFDEVQHCPATIWRKTTEEIQAVRKIGLTATPVREDKKERDIFSLIGPPIVDVGWLEMAEEGVIAEAEVYEVLVGMSPSTRARYHKASDWEKVLITSMNPLKVKAVREILEKHVDDPALIIGFYVDGAEEMGKALGVPVITGDTTTTNRDSLYQAFRQGEIKRLVLTSVGEEGINLPNARVGINICGLYGSRMGFSQRFGRILRPKEGAAYFYELATEGTVEQEYSERRREYLVSKGYDFDTIDMTEELG